MTNAQEKNDAQPKPDAAHESIITALFGIRHQVTDALLLNGIVWVWVYGVTHGWRWL